MTTITSNNGASSTSTTSTAVSTDDQTSTASSTSQSTNPGYTNDDSYSTSSNPNYEYVGGSTSSASQMQEAKATHDSRMTALSGEWQAVPEESRNRVSQLNGYQPGEMPRPGDLETMVREGQEDAATMQKRTAEAEQHIEGARSRAAEQVADQTRRDEQFQQSRAQAKVAEKKNDWGVYLGAGCEVDLPGIGPTGLSGGRTMNLSTGEVRNYESMNMGGSMIGADVGCAIEGGVYRREADFYGDGFQDSVVGGPVDVQAGRNPEGELNSLGISGGPGFGGGVGRAVTYTKDTTDVPTPENTNSVEDDD